MRRRASGRRTECVGEIVAFTDAYRELMKAASEVINAVDSILVGYPRDLEGGLLVYMTEQAAPREKITRAREVIDEYQAARSRALPTPSANLFANAIRALARPSGPAAGLPTVQPVEPYPGHTE
jgi:hypothetical protein